jgi:hypothetical protein
MVKEYAPNFVHDCPYYGLYEFSRVKGLKTVADFLPKGVLRFSAKCIDGDQKKFVLFDALIEIS